MHKGKSTRPEVYLVFQFMWRITSLYNNYKRCRLIYSCSTNIYSSNILYHKYSLNNSHPDQIFSNPNHFRQAKLGPSGPVWDGQNWSALVLAAKISRTEPTLAAKTGPMGTNFGVTSPLQISH